MKKNLKKSIVIIGCIVLTVAVSFCIFQKFFKNKDSLVSLKDDFYANINNEIIADHKLESDEAMWVFMFDGVEDKIDDNVKEIVKEIITKKDEYPAGTNEYKICKLYQSAVNRKDGTKKLDTYIKRIDNSENIDELMDSLIKINNELSMGTFINWNLENDFRDNTQTIVNIGPFSFDYGNTNADYYTNPEFSSDVEIYTEFDREIFKIYGYNDKEAEESVSKINKFYRGIAKKSQSNLERANVQSGCNIVTKEELEDIFSNINVDLFLTYSDEYAINVCDEKQARALNSYLTMENLETLKECIKLQILQGYGEYADIEYKNLMKKLDAKLSGTEITKDTMEDCAIDLISGCFNEYISKEYIKRHISSNSINRCKQMINDIIAEYKVKIKNNEWLSEKTKQKALLKLEKMKIYVGWPENWDEDPQKYSLNDNLLDNIINMNKVNVKHSENLVINKKQSWGDGNTPLTTNAWYQYTDNSINFPISWFESELYREDGSYYQLLGSFGSVIGHEISHAFDSNGALYDEKGNMRNWWQEEDYKDFQQLQKEVINYYNEYEFNGMAVNGELTVTENIADLGAMSCIVDVAKRKGATKEDLKTLFKSFANTFASKATDKRIREDILTDTHSPDKVRVNAVLSSIDEFYDVFDIKENDGMYKKTRVKVW